MDPKHLLGLVVALSLLPGVCRTVDAWEGVGSIPLKELSGHARSVKHLKAFKEGRECGLVARIQRLARHYDPALSSGPIVLRFYHDHGRLRGEVLEGHHRLLALIKRLGERAWVKDIPPAGWHGRPDGPTPLPTSALNRGVSMGELWREYCQVEQEAREIQRMITPPPAPQLPPSLFGWVRRLLR